MRRCSVALLVPLLIAFAAFAGSATAHHNQAKDSAGLTSLSTGPFPDSQISHGLVTGPDDGGGKSHLDQHGPSTGHLESSSDNVDLLGKLRLTSHEGDISDVSALQAGSGRWYAYVGDWGAHCETGGVRVADITNPSRPRRTAFIESPGFGYVTEGVQALHVDTPGPTGFVGDILVISNEFCRESPDPENTPGGISIWDITNPEDPKPLVEAFGDFDVAGDRANMSHSAIAWDAGARAFVAAIDNEEIEDVDFFEITDPRNPVKVSETRLPGVRVDAYGQEKTSHDFDVLRFGGSWHLMVSDWDAGWIDVNVDDPKNPVIVGDFDYAECDQVITSACPPEGNAHQGEWNSDGSLFVGTDEDLSPFRVPITVKDGPLEGRKIDAGEFGFTKQVASFPDEKVNGPTIFGGYGCPDDPVPPPSELGTLGPDEEAIIVFQRGPVGDPNHDHAACFFSDKIRAGEEAGYDVVIVANHHSGAQGGETPDAFFCGGQGSPVLGTAAGLCIGHKSMHELFDRPPDYTFPYPRNDPGDLEPNPGDLGPRVEAQSEFDGWGYARMVDTSVASAPNEVGQFAIPEVADPDFASGFGDIAVHEVEVPRGDPNEGGPSTDDDKLAYFAWYSGGFRVVDITDPAEPTEVGHHIDVGGNNHWGVALAEDQNGDRIVLASDRDFGLYIYRYTGELPDGG
jgi:hypothetical protein